VCIASEREGLSNASAHERLRMLAEISTLLLIAAALAGRLRAQRHGVPAAHAAGVRQAAGL
jgi:hypothetical protein